MNLKDYAQDVEKSIEEIKKLCDKIGISYDDEESLLTEEDISYCKNMVYEVLAECIKGDKVNSNWQPKITISNKLDNEMCLRDVCKMRHPLFLCKERKDEK